MPYWDPESIFTPETPVQAEFFVGREEEIKQILQANREALRQKRLKVVVIEGPRGIGKSSLAQFVREKFLLREKPRSGGKLLPVVVRPGRINKVDELCKRMVENSASELASLSNSLAKKIKQYFRRLIQSVEGVSLLGVTLRFRSDAAEWAESFPGHMRRLCRLAFEEGYAGFFLIVDDYTSVARIEGFSDHIKQWVEETAQRSVEVPVVLLLVGQLEARKTLIEQNPSLVRILDPIMLERLGEDDCKKFLIRAFEELRLLFENDALERLSKAAAGYPPLLHILGRTAVECDTDNHIDIQDVEKAIRQATIVVGHKYIEPTVYNSLSSRTYQQLLEHIADALDFRFLRSQLLQSAHLNERQKRNLHNFLRRMVEAGVIERVARGEYRFSNPLVMFYIRLKRSMRRNRNSGEKRSRANNEA